MPTSNASAGALDDHRVRVPALDLPASPTAAHRVDHRLADVRPDVVDPAPPEAPVHAGERVAHRVFGPGRIPFEQCGQPERGRVVLREHVGERGVPRRIGRRHPPVIGRHARHTAQTREPSERLPARDPPH